MDKIHCQQGKQKVLKSGKTDPFREDGKLESDSKMKKSSVSDSQYKFGNVKLCVCIRSEQRNTCTVC